MANTILQGKVEGKRSRGMAARQLFDDVKERTGLSLNDTWMEPKDSVAWRRRVRIFNPEDCIVYGSQVSRRLTLVLLTRVEFDFH